MISTKAKPSCKIHPNKVLREIKINVTIENRSNFGGEVLLFGGNDTDTFGAVSVVSETVCLTCIYSFMVVTSTSSVTFIWW